MRIANGVATNQIYFVAVDPTDLKTRKTSLSGFAVVRSRNGGAAVDWTTPTIVSLSSMAGVYALLVDEDTSLDAGYATQEFCINISHTSMATVTRVVELFRPTIPAGETLSVSAGIAASDVVRVRGVAAASATAGMIASDIQAIDADGAVDATLKTWLLSDISGTVDSGTTTTMVDAARTEADTDYWADQLLVIDSGANAGLGRVVTAFNAGTDTMTVDPAFPQALVAGVTYHLEPGRAVLRSAVPESFSTAGAIPTLSQMLHEIRQNAAEFSISGAVLTVVKADHSTTAMTYSLDSASNPTKRVRTT